MSDGARLLVVEDEADQRRLLARPPRRRGLPRRRGRYAAAGEARARAGAGRPRDLRLAAPGRRRRRAPRRAPRATHPDVGFVMVTAYGTIARAVEAIRAGADDYLAKPFERQALRLAVERTLERRRLARENRRLAEEIGERDRLVDLVGRSAAMQKLFARVERLAGDPGDCICSPARAAPARSSRRGRSTSSRRAAHVRSSPSTARRSPRASSSRSSSASSAAPTPAPIARAPGRFEAAERRHALSRRDRRAAARPAAQAPARAAGGAGPRVGGAREVAVDVRVVAATNRDLERRSPRGASARISTIV